MLFQLILQNNLEKKMSEHLVINIDGNELKAKPGQMILQAAMDAGFTFHIYVTTLALNLSVRAVCVLCQSMVSEELRHLVQHQLVQT